MASKKVETLVSSFKAVGVQALYGGGAKDKGHGFWLYDLVLEQSIKDQKNRSGNEWFWLVKDAELLLSEINAQQNPMSRVVFSPNRQKWGK